MPDPGLPLVSIVIVNWNYANFLRDCINSIKAQDYPHIEIIVLDNGSTDDSRSVIEECAKDDPRFRLIFLQDNIGQFKGALQCLEHVSGEFVCFADSDDYLLEDFITTHVQTHLALPFPVGITSSNTFEVSETNEVICATRREFHDLHKCEADGLRPLSARPARIPLISDEVYRALSKLVHYRDSNVEGWLWAPGSANCFRRSVLELVRPSRDLDIAVHATTDTQFAQLVHWISGTALIDKTLSAYRFHTRNYYSTHYSVRGLRGGGNGPGAKDSVVRYQLGLRIRILLDCQAKLTKMVGIRRFWELMRYAIGRKSRQQEKSMNYPQVQEAFAKALPSIVGIQGVKEAVKSMRVVLGLSHRAVLRILAQADASALPGNEIDSILRRKRFLYSVRRLRNQMRKKP